MKSNIYSGSNSYVNPPVYEGPGVSIGPDSYEPQNPANFVLLRLVQSVVSMLCYDGTDGKANAYQLTPVFDDGLDHAILCTWTSSNPAAAVVSSTGIVSAVLGGSGNVVISCIWKGTVKAALFTVFSSMPSYSSLLSLPGGKFCGVTFANNNGIDLLGVLNAYRYKAQIDTNANVLFYDIESPEKYVQMGLFGTHLYKWNMEKTSPSNIYQIQNRLLNAVPSDPAYDFDLVTVSPQSTQVEINGVSKTLAFDALDNYNPRNYLQLRFNNAAGNRITNFAFGETTAAADLLDYTKCFGFYVPQNFVKFSNDGTQIDYTEILNFGNGGPAYNLKLNNTPAGWF